jgi:hypothetical protein
MLSKQQQQQQQQLHWSVRQLTSEHDCKNKREQDAVRTLPLAVRAAPFTLLVTPLQVAARSRDPDAIKAGRVGGVIGVTRSIGEQHRLQHTTESSTNATPGCLQAMVLSSTSTLLLRLGPLFHAPRVFFVIWREEIAGVCAVLERGA